MTRFAAAVLATVIVCGALHGCVVVAVGSAAMSVASTVAGVGVTVGSAAVSMAGSAVKGTVNLASAAVN